MFDKLDTLILVGITKLAHWIDYRWHVNNYKIAQWVMQVAAIAVVLSGAFGVVSVTTIGSRVWETFIACVNILIGWLYREQAKKLRDASDRYEAGKENFIPRFAVSAYLRGPFFRLFAGFLPIFFAGPLISGDIILHHSWEYITLANLSRLWLFYGDCLAVYFAMALPPTRKRKEKKAIDWSFGLTLQPARAT